MIGFLRGTLHQTTSPSRVLLDVGGVGYAVNIPLSTFYELQKQGDDAEVMLHVYTHVRETELALFGFWTEREKTLFERLITISGIGPKLAQTVLSGMSPEDFAAAIAAADARALSRVPGVGKKTAERMVVELKDKIGDLIAPAEESAAPPPSEQDEDLVTALVNLGYKPVAAEKAVMAVREATAKEGLELEFAEILRRSLKRLSRL